MLAHTADRALEPAQRRRLGQHYTPAPVAELIVAACVRRPGAVVLDPACGAGAFLVRAAERLDALGGGRLLGLELDPQAAALARAALTGRDADVRCGDAFGPEAGAFGPGDALATNPPYLELRRAGNAERRGAAACARVAGGATTPPYLELRRAGNAERRAAIAAAVARAWPGLRLSGRSDVYASMLVCAAAALRPGGRLGVVTSRAWLDAAYGEALQQFLAQRFRLLAVVERRAEAWFADAAVNPVVLLAERCDEPARAAVPLAVLRRPLGELLAGGWGAADRLVDALLSGRSAAGVEVRSVPQ